MTNGKNAMPAFGGKLSDGDIADVAAYVEDMANKGWADSAFAANPIHSRPLQRGAFFVPSCGSGQQGQ